MVYGKKNSPAFGSGTTLYKMLFLLFIAIILTNMAENIVFLPFLTIYSKETAKFSNISAELKSFWLRLIEMLWEGGPKTKIIMGAKLQKSQFSPPTITTLWAPPPLAPTEIHLCQGPLQPL